MGLLGSDRQYRDTVVAGSKGVKLKTEWKRYEFKLKNEDLTRVKTPFVWTLAGRGRPVTLVTTCSDSHTRRPWSAQSTNSPTAPMAMR